MDFDSIESAIKFIEDSVENVLRADVSKVSVDIVKNELDMKLYSMPESDYYIRTGELRNSVVSIFDDKFEQASKKGLKRIEITHDTSSTFMPSGHRSWVNGRMQNSNIPMWIDGGFQGILPTAFVGINYFDSSFNRISNEIIPTMIKGLKKYGITAT